MVTWFKKKNIALEMGAVDVGLIPTCPAQHILGSIQVWPGNNTQNCTVRSKCPRWGPHTMKWWVGGHKYFAHDGGDILLLFIS